VEKCEAQTVTRGEELTETMMEWSEAGRTHTNAQSSKLPGTRIEVFDKVTHISEIAADHTLTKTMSNGQRKPWAT